MRRPGLLSPEDDPGAGEGLTAADHQDLLRRLQAAEDRIEEVNARASRTALGALEHEERVDCPCGQILGLRDSRTGTVRGGQSGLTYQLPSGSQLLVGCRRCHKVTLIGERGEVVCTVDGAQVVRGWRPGDPLPVGCLPV